MSEIADEPLAPPASAPIAAHPGPASAPAPTAAPPINRLAIKVRYPSNTGEKEFKVRVKETDTIGRVLTAVCFTSGLSINRYVSDPCPATLDITAVTQGADISFVVAVPH